MVIATIEEKIYLNDLRPATESHIKTNPAACLICKGKECTVFCPGNVFQWSNIDEELIVAYENCLECGACTMGCPFEAIEYKHPEN